MTTAKDELPVQDALFLAPPKPEREPKKFKPWHWVALGIGVPVIAFLSCVGANLNVSRS
jgi:hypothetical protein